MFINIHTLYMCIFVRKHVHKHTRTHTHTHIRAYTHAHTHKFIYTYILYASIVREFLFQKF